MPQAIIKDPEGNEIATINIPEGATNEQIQQKIQAVKTQAMQRNQAQPQAQAQTEQTPQDEQGFLGAAGETAGFVGKSLGAQMAGGLAGIATGVRNNFAEGLRRQGFNDAASFIESSDDMGKVVESTISSLSPNAPSERSQAQLQDVGGFMEKAADVVQVPVSGLMGLGELATGQGLDQASQTVQNVQEQGISQTLGDRTLEETGSPLAATLAYTAPDLIPYGAAGKGLAKGIDAASDAIRGGAKGVQQVKQGITGQLNPSASQLKSADMRKAIQDGSKYYVDKKIDPVSGRIIDDELAKKALKQNITDETIAHAKRLDKGTRKEANKILNRGAEILEYGEKTGGRPNTIIGERVMKRFDTVLDANRKAGKDIGESVKAISNQTFDTADILDNWEDSLQSLNIQRIDGKLSFKGSDIELNPSTIKVIKTADNRLKANFTAEQLHKEKKFIANAIYDAKADINVPFSDAGEKALDKLRDGFNQKLRDASPDYALANDKYSETITTLNDFRKVMGQKKFNPYSDRIDNTIGNESRKLLTQYKSGQDMQEAIKNLNNMSSKYGGKYDDDIVELTRFYDNMEREFKSFSQGSFQAQTRDAMKDTAGVAFDAATGAPIQAGKGALRVGSKLLKKDPTERTKIKALKDLLKENK